MQIAISGKSGRMGKSLLEQIMRDPSLKVVDSLKEADLIIDFSHPTTLNNLLNLNKPLVIGTTGFSEEEFEKIKIASKVIPIFYSANFSLGIAILTKTLSFIEKNFPSAIDIVETHHLQKRDMPSGTALRLAKALKTKPKIHSIRAGSIIGEHSLFFTAENERISIKHEAFSRSLFCEGAILAAKFLIKQKKGLYSMEDLVKQ